MGKTIRALPYWAKPVPDDELERYAPHSRRRMERFNKKIQNRIDGAFCSVIHGADPKSPKGYNTWDDVWGPHRKRKEKALTHRMARRTAQIDDGEYDDMVDAQG